MTPYFNKKGRQLMSAFQAFGAGNGIRTRDLQLGKLADNKIMF